MKIVDLTHYISEDMPVYPGTEPPKLAQANTYEADGFKETLMTMFSLTGPHIWTLRLTCSATEQHWTNFM